MGRTFSKARLVLACILGIFYYTGQFGFASFLPSDVDLWDSAALQGAATGSSLLGDECPRSSLDTSSNLSFQRDALPLHYTQERGIMDLGSGSGTPASLGSLPPTEQASGVAPPSKKRPLDSPHEDLGWQNIGQEYNHKLKKPYVVNAEESQTFPPSGFFRTRNPNYFTLHPGAPISLEAYKQEMCRKQYIAPSSMFSTQPFSGAEKEVMDSWPTPETHPHDYLTKDHDVSFSRANTKLPSRPHDLWYNSDFSALAKRPLLVHPGAGKQQKPSAEDSLTHKYTSLIQADQHSPSGSASADHSTRTQIGESQELSRLNPVNTGSLEKNFLIISNPSSPSQREIVGKDTEIDINRLEKAFAAMKSTVAATKDDLSRKVELGKKLNDEEEEWLDGDGNLVAEQMLMDHLLSIPNASKIHLTSEQIQLTNKILTFLDSPAKTKPQDVKVQVKPPENSHEESSGQSSKKIIQRRAQATRAQKIEVLDWYHANGKNQNKTAQHFSGFFPKLRISQPRVSTWLKDELNIRRNEKAEAELKAQQLIPVIHPEVDTALEQWVQVALKENVPLSAKIIRRQWRKQAKAFGIPRLEWHSLGDSWLQAFKSKNGLHFTETKGQSHQAPAEEVSQEVHRLQEILKDYNPVDIYNMDETGLFYAMPPDTSLAKEVTKHRKPRFTVAFTCNATGSDKLPPLFIGRFRRPKAFKGKFASQLGIQYYSNEKSCMTSEIFQNWLAHWNQELFIARRSILLLVENSPGHECHMGDLSNIKLEYISPKLTSDIQPIDAGIMKLFKFNYRMHFLSQRIWTCNSSEPPEKFYDIDMLTAIRFSEKAWESITANIIQKCWDQTNVLKTPLGHVGGNLTGTRMDSFMESKLSKLLDQLEKMRIIHSSNRMSTSEFLNPDGETGSGKELLSAENALQLLKAQNSKSGQEITKEIYTKMTPVPSLKGALEAMAVLSHFSQSDSSPQAKTFFHELKKYNKVLVARVAKNSKQKESPDVDSSLGEGASNES